MWRAFLCMPWSRSTKGLGRLPPAAGNNCDSHLLLLNPNSTSSTPRSFFPLSLLPLFASLLVSPTSAPRHPWSRYHSSVSAPDASGPTLLSSSDFLISLDTRFCTRTVRAPPHSPFDCHSNIIRPSCVPSTIFPVDSEKAHRIMSSGRCFSLSAGEQSFGRIHPPVGSQALIMKMPPVDSIRGATSRSSCKLSPDSTRTPAGQLWLKETATTNPSS